MAKYKIKHVAISVGDLDAQRKFYRSAFELTVDQALLELDGGNTRMVILGNEDGLEIELVERKGSAANECRGLAAATARQGYFAVALQVSDLDVAFDRVVASGATAITRPADASRPGVRFAYVQDPEGNLFELLETQS